MAFRVMASPRVQRLAFRIPRADPARRMCVGASSSASSATHPHESTGMGSSSQSRTSLPNEIPQKPDRAACLVDRLEALEQKGGLQLSFMRLIGMFKESQWQKAAGHDLYHQCTRQAMTNAKLYHSDFGGVDSARYFSRFQLKGIHCWLAHVRLREEPAAQYKDLFAETMEIFWELTIREIVESEGLDLLRALKFQKQLQVTWHGTALALDTAIAAEDPRDALSEALLRNLYADEDDNIYEASRPASLWMADYILGEITHQQSISSLEILRGRIGWSSACVGESQ